MFVALHKLPLATSVGCPIAYVSVCSEIVDYIGLTYSPTVVTFISADVNVLVVEVDCNRTKFL